MVLMRLFFILLLLGITACNGNNTAKNKEVLPIETPAEKGASLYTLHCASCHGEDGKLGASGAKDLSVSTLTDGQVKKILKNGKNAMPPMSAILETAENMTFVMQHIKTLRK
jgi:mono/diheme cytochrome c family protein